MKRIIFLIAILFFVNINAAEAQQDGMCMKYNGYDCVQFRYCSSKSTQGCNDYETCTMDNGRFLCSSQLDPNKQISRPLSFVDEKVRNLRKPSYTDPIVEKTLNKPIVDYFYPVEKNSRYAPINQDNYKTYYPPKDQPYTLGETYPRRDVWVNDNPPYYKNLLKRKTPTRSSKYGAGLIY